MIGRIVITSVPQGIDGGTGFQPVLRTQELNPSIAKRLALRASYPHPYDFGHPRNPRVLFHRIETVGDRSIHILGSVRDAGSSYTGRSNHLAELIAIDPAEIRGIPGGPVFACRTFPWLGNWAGEPREVPIAEEPGVPSNDPADPEASGRSEPCVAWAAASGDPGWAGELAKSFLDGRRAAVWVDEGVDAAALFAEAIRLLPVSNRWQVEFNTCEIEPFPVHWRALRPDIMLVGPRPGHGGELVLNLSEIKRNSERSPDHALTHHARGESTARGPTGGTHGTQTAGTWPTGGNGFSGTPTGTTTSEADEAAIRERLKEIRESRQRRSPRDPVLQRAEQAPGGLGVWSILFLVGIVVLCGFLMSASIVAVQYPERAHALVDRARAIVGMDGGHAADESSIGLRTHTETTDLLAKKKKEMEEQAAQKKADEEASKKAELATQQRDEADRKKKKADNEREERVASEKHEAAAKTTAEAKVAAIKDFTSVAEIRTIPLTQTFPDKVLCPFDAEHLRDAACDLAVIGSETVRMSVERSAAVDGQPPTWTVTGSQFDAISQSWGPPVTVCRLAVRDRMLRLEWPTPEISPEHNLFHAIENGLLIVSCKTAAGDFEIRKILFAEPIDLADSGTAEITLDPLAGDDARAGKDDAQFSSGLAARLKVIEPSALRWSLEVTHPQWTVPEQLRNPDEQLPDPNKQVKFKLPPLPAGVAIGYQQVDPEGPGLVQLAGQLQIKATLTFSPQEASLKLDSEITGLDTVPLLKSVITVEALRDAFRRQRGLKPLERAVQKVLTDRFLNEKYCVLVFDAFAQGSDDCKKLGITNFASFESSRQNLPRELHAIRVPGTTYVNPNGIGGSTYTNQQEYENNLKAHAEKVATLTRIGAAFLNLEREGRAGQEANAIRKALETNKTWFAPITVKIQSLGAVATDSKGKEYKISIVTTPKK